MSDTKERTQMSALKAFLLGITEFRSDLTTHYGPDLIETYDRGRNLAHFLTLRRFEA